MEIPSFDPKVPPHPHAAPTTSQTAVPQATAEMESGRQALREPETYPRPPPETAEDRKSEIQRAIREKEWTTTEFGLEAEGHTNVPQLKIVMVSPIQCQICATHWIPALRFCYQCFPNVAVTYIITATYTGDTYRYNCKMCFTEMKTRAAIYQQCAKNHIPKEYVDLRYPFLQDKLAVIASRDDDMDNAEVDPRTLHCDGHPPPPGATPGGY